MRHGIFIEAIFIFCLSCNNHPNDKSIKKDDVQHDYKASYLKIERKKLIQELYKLQLAFKTKDKKAITDYFNFPLADSSISILEVDSTFDDERARNGNLITREMFENHFDKLYEYCQMKEFSNLFQSLLIDSLQNKDTLNFERHFKNEGCYYIYNISINSKEITLQYGTNSDDNYRKKHPTEEEICGEYASFWIFEFDGQKLHLKKQMTAG